MTPEAREKLAQRLRTEPLDKLRTILRNAEHCLTNEAYRAKALAAMQGRFHTYNEARLLEQSAVTSELAVAELARREKEEA